jgi:Domain of unknown function (DUF4276)
MRRVVVVCEGPTEEAFIAQVMAPALFDLGLHLQGVTLQTSVGHKGGAMSADRLLRGIRDALSQPSAHAVRTFIDLYRLDTSAPGYASASHHPLPERLQRLEAALHDRVLRDVGCRPDRFIAHIQPYEFEALLFSNVASFGLVDSAWAAQLVALHKARQQAASPEAINDGPTTSPAARLKLALQQPGYRKLRHGPIVAKRIGLPTIEAECPHFRAWLARLRRLAAQG